MNRMIQPAVPRCRCTTSVRCASPGTHTILMLSRIWDLRHDVTAYDAAYLVLSPRPSTRRSSRAIHGCAPCPDARGL
jgi:hypothetical protein